MKWWPGWIGSCCDPAPCKIMLRRKKKGLETWEAMVGLTPGQHFTGNLTTATGDIDYRKGEKRWKTAYLRIDRGFLCIFRTKAESNNLSKAIFKIDLGSSIIRTEKNLKRVELNNGEESSLELRDKKTENFQNLVDQIHLHRCFRDEEILNGSKENPQLSALPVPRLTSEPGIPLILQKEPIPKPTNPDEHTPDWVVQVARLEQDRSSVQEEINKLGSLLPELSQGLYSKKAKSSWGSFKQKFKGKTTTTEAQEQNEGKAQEMHAEFVETARRALESLRRQQETLATEHVRLRFIAEGGGRRELPGPSRPTPASHLPPLKKASLTRTTSEFCLSNRPATPTGAGKLRKGSSTRISSATRKTGSLKGAGAMTQMRKEMRVGSDEELQRSVTCPDLEYTDATDIDETDIEPDSEPSVEEETEPTLLRRRQTLPAFAQPAAAMTMWNVLSILKTPTRPDLPISLFEPLTNLQRICEELEYSNLLDKLVEEKEALKRVCIAAAFAVSGYCGTFRRGGRKPFQPMLGETFHCERWDELGWRFHAEQVQHKPIPISACHAEGRAGWVWTEDMSVETKFTATTLDFIPTGRVHITVKKTSEKFSFNKVMTVVSNFHSPEKRCVSHHGEMSVESTSGYTIKLHFPKGVDSKIVTGKAMDSKKTVVATLEGKWMEGLSYRQGSQPPSILFQAIALPADEYLYYGFSALARTLNELPLSETDVLPPTDSRRRKDVRALEEGRPSVARTEKLKLEAAQRRRRDAPNSSDIPYTPLWFKQQNIDGRKSWVSNGEYWKAAAKGFKNIKTLPLFID